MTISSEVLSDFRMELERHLELQDDDHAYFEVNFQGLGLDPTSATGARPGSTEKVVMLAARYAAGLPLWNHGDCCDQSSERIDFAQLRQHTPRLVTES